jgi:glycosyltransferase involved in cell wall biosynthesis
VANHAFVYHVGNASFSHSQFKRQEEANQKILLRRYPEYSKAIERFVHSIEFKAQRLVSGFIPDPRGRHRILFECSNLQNLYNGASELTRPIIAKFVERHSDRYACEISCSFQAWKFHQFDQISGLAYAGELHDARSAGPYMAAIRLAHPWFSADLSNLASLAPLTGFLMLDTIALDCQNLDTHDVWSLWQRTLQTTSIIGYISQFSCNQYRSRFRIPAHVIEAVTLLSTNSVEYEPKTDRTSSGISQQTSNDYLLLVGNHHEHKALREALAFLEEHGNTVPLVVLGWKHDDREGLRHYGAGKLTPELITELYAGARAVLYPSHYEGFGLPILHALANRKPVIARNLPSAMEIKQRTVHGGNIHLFDTTAEMVLHAMSRPRWIEKSSSPPLPVQSWCDAADAWESAIDRARQKFRFDSLCERLHILSSANAPDLPSSASAPDLQPEVVRLQALVHAYESSTSWRLTAPLRTIVTLVRSCWQAVGAVLVPERRLRR